MTSLEKAIVEADEKVGLILMLQNGTLIRPLPEDGSVAVSYTHLTAREPWEESEAFLIGPVDELGLDPNMDSWPLDQNAIVQILNSQKWGDLEWSEGDDDAKVESAQNVRGFHTLEFLLFKDGKPRTVK